MAKKNKVVVQLNKKKNKTKRQAAPAKQVSPGLLGTALRALGTAGGTALGGFFGAPVTGGAAGNSLGAAISKWLGAGDYTVGSNSIVRQSMKASASIPAMHNDQQSVVIRHKEYLGEIQSAQSFTVQQSFPINPGLSTTFPWLSNIASSFQEYKIRGLVFHYVPSSGFMGSTTSPSLGTVMLQTSYRSNDSAPGNKVELLNEFWSNEVVPTEPMAHPIECDPKENPFNVQYIRSGAVPSGDTSLMYDLGVTHVAVSGCQVDGKVLGDLWVTYEIELKKPLVASNSTFRVESAWYNTVTNLTMARPWGPGGTMAGPIPVVISNSGTVTTFTFPKGIVGNFNFLGGATGTSFVMTSPSVTYTNCLNTGPFEVPTDSWAVVVSGRFMLAYGFAITDPAKQASISIDMGGATGAPTTGSATFLQRA